MGPGRTAWQGGMCSAIRIKGERSRGARGMVRVLQPRVFSKTRLGKCQGPWRPSVIAFYDLPSWSGAGWDKTGCVSGGWAGQKGIVLVALYTAAS